jgi:hypothetical protein
MGVVERIEHSLFGIGGKHLQRRGGQVHPQPTLLPANLLGNGERCRVQQPVEGAIGRLAGGQPGLQQHDGDQQRQRAEQPDHQASVKTQM